jgi:hypothetical protein
LDLNGIKGLTPKGAAMLRQCLTVDQADRFLTADLLADALQACADEDPERMAQQRKNVALKVVVASIVSAVLAATAAIYAYNEWLDSKRNYVPPPAVSGEGRFNPVQALKVTPREKTEAPTPVRPPLSATPTTQPSAGLDSSNIISPPPQPSSAPVQPSGAVSPPPVTPSLPIAPLPSSVPAD